MANPRERGATERRIAELRKLLASDRRWWSSAQLLDRAAGPTKRVRVQYSLALFAMLARSGGEVERTGKPPRGCKYRLRGSVSTDTVPADPQPECEPEPEQPLHAIPYQAPVLQRADLRPALGTICRARKLEEEPA